MNGCSKCKLAKVKLGKKGIEYKEVNINESDENMKLAESYNVTMGGTLVNDENGEILNINSL
jgi:glutaredoxin